MQFWALFWGGLIIMTGQSLIWPFLTIYVRQQLDLPLAQVTLLFPIQSLAALAATSIVGPAMDRFGRKWAMVAGLIGNGLIMLLMIGASSFGVWAVLLSAYAVASVLFRIASQTMIADLLPANQRVDAYALLRMAFNVGIAVGPAVGGLLIAFSYAFTFLIAAVVQICMGLIIAYVVHETLDRAALAAETPSTPRSAGYGPVLRDRPFMAFWGVYLLLEIASSLVFTLLTVYVKEQYAIAESDSSFIIMTNALMVVFLQYAVTRVTRRHPAMKVMAVSGLFYGAGLAIFAVSASLPAFWLGMVVMTFGELILSPTSTALVAELAPADKRARYMGLYSLSYRVSSGVGPVIGGVLNDALAPAATWWFGSLAALLSSGGFVLMGRSRAAQPSITLPGAAQPAVTQPTPVPDPVPVTRSGDR